MIYEAVLTFKPGLPSFKGPHITGAWQCRYIGWIEQPVPIEVKPDGLHLTVVKRVRPGSFCNPAKLAVEACAAIREGSLKS